MNEDCIAAFLDLKLKKLSKYIIFSLNKEKTEIITVKTSTVQDYDEFLADLPENECRWAVYDFEFEKEDGGRRNKIIFYNWYVFSQLATLTSPFLPPIMRECDLFILYLIYTCPPNSFTHWFYLSREHVVCES